MQHFLSIADLDKNSIETLITRALYFKNNSIFPAFKAHKLATLFYENSTRTRVSFELAAFNLAIPTINMAIQTSSEAKGESILDTINTLAAMGIDLFVIRHEQNGLPASLAAELPNGHILNAGDGTQNHPSQALLDLMTIVEVKPHLAALKIAIIGNVKHSRVAFSLQQIFAKVGVKEVVLIAPEIWQPEMSHATVTDNLKNGLQDADVVICLRVQNERLQAEENLDKTYYREHFAITAESIKLAKADAMVMHPGPINRGMEIDSDVADGKQSFILKQVSNGVFMRMAMIEFLLTC